MRFNIDINEYKSLAELDNLRKEMNEAINGRIESLLIANKANEISAKAFGYIKESFENFAPALFENKEGREIIKKYTSTIKANKSLSAMHNLYENIRKSNKSTDVDFFINSLSNTELNIDSRELKEGRKVLGDILAEAFINIGKSAEEMLPTENAKLDSAIEYIAENKKSAKNLSDYSAAVKILRENIEKNEATSTIFEAKDLDSIASELLREYNEKYNDQLSEKEKTIVKEIAESNSPSDVFNKYKSACEVKLSEARANFEKTGDSSSVKKLDSILEQVSKKVYTPETIGEDICNLVEISSIFE